MAKRKAISKKLRFEVFKRDSFTCQYCGKSAPDVVLHVDHINPVANGGDLDILNLITSCLDCNLGKGARLLSDKSVVAKQRKQLEELNEKRQQLEMMLKWRKGLDELGTMQIDEVEACFKRLTGKVFTDFGKQAVKSWLKKYTLQEILDAMETSAAQYLRPDKSGFTQQSIDKVFDYTPRICNVVKNSKEKPYLPDLLKLKWLVKKQLYGFREWEVLKVLEEAHLDGASISVLRGCINESASWRDFQDQLLEATGVYYGA